MTCPYCSSDETRELEEVVFDRGYGTFAVTVRQQECIACRGTFYVNPPHEQPWNLATLNGRGVKTT